MDVIGLAGKVMSNILFEVVAVSGLVGVVHGRIKRTEAQDEYDNQAYEEGI